MSEKFENLDTVKVIQTKICNRYDDLAEWDKSDLILEKGEIALAVVIGSNADKDNEDYTEGRPEGQQGDYNTPTVMMKVGDGENVFKDLKWVAAPASDVYNWAKQSTFDAGMQGSNFQATFDNLTEGLTVGSNKTVTIVDRAKGQMVSGSYKTVLNAIVTELKGLNINTDVQYKVSNGKLVQDPDQLGSSGIIDQFVINVTNAKEHTNSNTSRVIVKKSYINENKHFGTATHATADGNHLVGDYTNQLSAKRITGLTKFMQETNTAIQNIDNMLGESGKVMEFVGTIDTKENLDLVSSKGYFSTNSDDKDVDGAAIKGHKLQLGDVVAVTSTADEYIWTLGDSNNYVYRAGSTYYRWEEFGHANATDAALDTFAKQFSNDGIDYDYTKDESDPYTSEGDTKLQVIPRIARDEGKIQAAEERLDNIDETFANLEKTTPHIESMEAEDGTPEGEGLAVKTDTDDIAYIVFDCGSSAIRTIDRRKAAST